MDNRSQNSGGKSSWTNSVNVKGWARCGRCSAGGTVIGTASLDGSAHLVLPGGDAGANFAAALPSVGKVVLEK